MAFVIKDRVRETTTTTGTSAISLGGTSTSFEAFSDHMSNADTTHYAIVHSTADEWEVGLGTWNTGNTLTRTTVLSSSNSNAAVSFTSGSKDVFMTYPASQSVSNLPLSGGTMTGDVSLGDNVSLNLGDADDASLVFDGTDTTLNSAGELILNGQTGITIDGNNITNQNTIVLSDMGAGNTGILLKRASGGNIKYGSSMDHSRPLAISGTNKSLGFSVAGSLGDASYAAFDFRVDANASNRHPAVMAVRSPDNNALLFQGEQSDSTVVFSVDYDGNVVTSGTVDGVDIASRDGILTSTTTTANDALPKAGGTLTGAITTNSTFDGRDVATDGAKLDGIATSANNYTHPNHSGEVTSTGDGATVISDNVVDEANLKVSNTPTDGYVLTAQSGNTGGLTWAAAATGSYLPLSGGTLTGNVNFGDDDKAIFGAGSDLEIYHDGSHSYIRDTGTGNLNLVGANIVFQGQTSGQWLFSAYDSGATTLYHQGATKLATTTTGIDVTGTVTSDGLTVDGGASSPTHLLTGSRAGTLVSIDNESASTSYGLLTNTASVSANSYPLWVTSNDVNRLTVGGNGDISFYEDTGTTPKMVWKSADERLGIGTSSPSEKLDVTGNIAVSGTVDGRDIATNIPSSLGTAGQVLTVNSGATATEWADASGGGGGGITTGKAIAMAMVFG